MSSDDGMYRAACDVCWAQKLVILVDELRGVQDMPRIERRRHRTSLYALRSAVHGLHVEERLVCVKQDILRYEKYSLSGCQRCAQCSGDRN